MEDVHEVRSVTAFPLLLPLCKSPSIYSTLPFTKKSYLHLFIYLFPLSVSLSCTESQGVGKKKKRKGKKEEAILEGPHLRNSVAYSTFFLF